MRRVFVVLLISFLIFPTCVIPLNRLRTIVKADLSGPKSDFEFQTFASFDEAYQALKMGTVDMLDYPLSDSQLLDALNDPNLNVVAATSCRMYLFDLNNNYTIAEYLGVKSPLHELKFRQAIAYAIDKDYIIESFWGNMAKRIDQPLPLTFPSWMNETYLGDSYPYKYNLTYAAQLLDELGFVDTDENGWRNYPADWLGAPNADFTQYPLKVLVRSDHQQRLNSGLYFVQQLETIGIKCYTITGPSDIMLPMIIIEQNYHIYTSGWGVWYPNALYFLYHSDCWTFESDDSQFNYVTGMNESNLPNYPQLDSLLENVYH
ncbi:MAG: ABC transporter substrate-binding protein, partial [Candidatus Jordarchaeaceae archaeon]